MAFVPSRRSAVYSKRVRITLSTICVNCPIFCLGQLDMQRVSDYFRLASLWRWLRAAYVALAFAAATTAIAAESPSRELQAGQYMTEGGMASLSVSAAEASGQSFQISSEGVNGSFCGVSGTIKEGEAGVTALGSEPALVCKIGFQ